MDEQVVASPELAAIIGQRLRDVRRARGWSQQALAEGLFSKGYVSSIEHGKIFPSVRALQALAARLGVDMSEFFDPAMLGHLVPPPADDDGDVLRRNRLLLHEVRALAAAGQPGVLQSARALDPETLTLLEQVELNHALAQAHLAAGAPGPALDLLEQALHLLAGAPETPAQSELSLRVQVLIGEALLLQGRADLAVEHFARLRQADLSDPGLRLCTLSGLARAYAALGDVPHARAIYHEALTLAQESQSLDKLALQALALSRQAAAAQRWDDAERHGHAGVLLSDAYQTLQRVLQIYLQFGALLRPGYNGSARGLIESAIQLAGQLGSAGALAQAEAELALLEIEAGHFEATQAALARAHEAAEAAQDARARGPVAYAAARLAQATGHPAEAIDRLQAAIGVLQEGGDQPLLAEACFTLARLLVAAGRPVDAAPYYEQAFTARAGAPGPVRPA